jgi:hypothetical protein
MTLAFTGKAGTLCVAAMSHRTAMPKHTCGGVQRTAAMCLRTMVCALALSAGAGLLRAQTSLDKDSVQVDVPKGLSLWQPFFNARAGAGYKDNVLLSPMGLGGSGLNFTELEATLVRLPADGTQVNLYALGEDRRYWRSGLVDKEQTGLVLAQIKRDFSTRWQGTLTAQYLYHDQVFDVSTTEQTITTVQAQANAFVVRPALRRELPGPWWTELELELTRYEFIAPLDDYWEGGPRAVIVREYGHQSELTLAAQYRQRAYENREQVSLAGLVQPGLALRLNEYGAELAVRHHWDAAKKWRGTLRLNLAREEDNGAGYFDNWRWQTTTQLEYRAKDWLVRARARGALSSYSHQPVSAVNPETRERFSFSASLRVERRLDKRWKALAEYERELASSNRPFDGYRANTIVAGFEWEY